MDPRHRDRIAFVRIVSGEFERGMSVNLLPVLGRPPSLVVTQFSGKSWECDKRCCRRYRGLRYRYLSGWRHLDGWKNTWTTANLLPLRLGESFAKNVTSKTSTRASNNWCKKEPFSFYKNYQTGEYMLGAVYQLQFEVFKHRMLRMLMRK